MESMNRVGVVVGDRLILRAAEPLAAGEEVTAVAVLIVLLYTYIYEAPMPYVERTM